MIEGCWIGRSPISRILQGSGGGRKLTQWTDLVGETLFAGHDSGEGGTGDKKIMLIFLLLSEKACKGIVESGLCVLQVKLTIM